MKALQKFSKEYLENCKSLKPEEIIQFLQDFTNLHSQPTKSKPKLISIKVPENLLDLFRKKADLEGIAYQTQIKKLMYSWLKT
jgi:predicted DNA binding CopG/RHH family protein